MSRKHMGFVQKNHAQSTNDIGIVQTTSFGFCSYFLSAIDEESDKLSGLALYKDELSTAPNMA